LAPAAREQVLEPFRQGVRGFAEDVRVSYHPWGFRLGDIHNVEVYLWQGELDSIVPASTARAMAAAIPGCHATFYPDESHDTYGRHTREILTALSSGTESEHNDPETVESPQM
jgi:pimeloyl-ACP methyl ester carboxylesterase